MPTCWEVLGLERDASLADIKERWRHLIKQAHPDHGGTRERFDELLAAYNLAVNLAYEAKCPVCNGDGEILDRGGSFAAVHTRCKECNGSGKKETCK